MAVLSEMLNEMGYQQQTITILSQLGPKARAAAPLADGIHSRREARLVLTPATDRYPRPDRSRGKTIAPALVKLVRDPDRGVRTASLAALAKIGQECDVTPALADLRTNDFFQRQALHRALRQLGPKAKGATPALLELVRGPDGPIRLEAAETLGKVAPEHL